jgi:phytoene synthase
VSKQLSQIFQQGSTTYFLSSLFFPPATRDKVTRLYAYVRTADNFVDATPQQATAFDHFVSETKKAWAGKSVNEPIITSFVGLCQEVGIEWNWVEAFLQSMEWDLHKKTYANVEELEQYMYGSAEVIGLMMAKVMSLPDVSYPAAQMLGRAMQYCNFLRDIAEDNQRGRTYIPQTILAKYHFSSLQEAQVRAQPAQFAELMRAEINRWQKWQQQAEAGFRWIPWRYRIAIRTASELYKWTLQTISQDPLVVFTRKIKPTKARVALTAMKVAGQL